MRKVAPWQAIKEGHVRVYVTRPNGDMLCLRRREVEHKDEVGVETFRHGGQWETVQGTMKPGEIAMAAAVRELQEETGYYVAPDGWTETAERTWKVVLPPDSPEPELSDEHDAFVWRPEPVALQNYFGRTMAKAELPIDEHDADAILRAAERHLDVWDALAKELAPLLGEAAAEGVVQGFGELDIDDDRAFHLANADAVDFAADRAAELVGRQRQGDMLLLTDSPPPWAITQSTREGLRDLVKQALDEGWGADELGQAVQDSALFSASRAEMIARTELAIAHSQGNLAAWRRSGVVQGKQWLLAPDHDDDDDCDENAAAGVIPLDASFPNGDPGPPAHPNCKCVVMPVVEEA